MRVYEATLQYNLISLGEDIVLDTPEKVTAYLATAFAATVLRSTPSSICAGRQVTLSHLTRSHQVTPLHHADYTDHQAASR